MTPDELHILQHSIGVDKYGRRSRYSDRNHFVTTTGSIDHPICLQLVAKGLMTRTPGNEITAGDDLFHVTKEGLAYVRVHSPAPSSETNLTRSQKRYRIWLNADLGCSFAEWLGVPNSGRRHG